MIRKISRVLEDKSVQEFEWPHLYKREEADDAERLVIAPRQDAMGLMPEFAAYLGSDLFILYVLTIGRGTLEGRYESPLLALEDVRAFLGEFRECLEEDSRHELWIGCSQEQGMVVYDNHGLLFAYGPLTDFERVLRRHGFVEGSFTIPFPHQHVYQARYDVHVERILARWEWRRSELDPTDGQ